MKYKILTLLSAMVLAALMSGCGDRMMAEGQVSSDVRPYATTMPRVTTMPNTTTRPAATEVPGMADEDGSRTSNGKKQGNALEKAENDLERTADKVEDELSDGDGIVR